MMKQKKIFIFEFASGGGFVNEEMSISLFCEGYGMLRTIISDFKKQGFQVSTLLDYRVVHLSHLLEADEILTVEKNSNYIDCFIQSVRSSKYCFIIAPEFSNILYDLTKIIEENQKIILSPKSEGVKIGTSKIRTYEYFNSRGLPTPKTWLIPRKENDLDRDFIESKFHKLGTPAIIKPNDGVGAENIWFFENWNDFLKEVGKIRELMDLNREYIIQEYIKGEDLSLTLIGDKRPFILSVNSQNLNIRSNRKASEYYGGSTPHKNQEKIMKEIQRLFEPLDFSLFSGFFGIDFILKEDNSLSFIEINPRLTTSYVGLSKILNTNPIEFLINPTANRIIDEKVYPVYHSLFTRLELIFEDHQSLDKVANEIIPELDKQILEFIIPPTTFNSKEDVFEARFSCLIVTKCKNEQDSKERIKQIREILKRNHFKPLN